MLKDAPFDLRARIVLLMVIYWLVLGIYVPLRGMWNYYSFAAGALAVLLITLYALGLTDKISRFLGGDVSFALSTSVIATGMLGVVYFYTPGYEVFSNRLVEGLPLFDSFAERTISITQFEQDGQIHPILGKIAPIFVLSYALLAVAGILAGCYSLTSTSEEGGLPAAVRWLRKHLVWVVIVLAVFARISMIVCVPEPRIDVFQNATGGAAAFLQGKNPYSAEFKQVYSEQELMRYYGTEIENYYPYLPGVLLMTVPSKGLLGDVRYAYLAAELLAALLLIKIASGGVNKERQPEARRLGELAAMVFILNPRGSFMVERGWVEVLMVVTLAAFACFYAVKKRPVGAAVFAGITLATKQYMILLPLLLLRMKNMKFRGFLWCLGVGSVIVLPFAVWNPSAFFNDTVKIFLDIIPRDDAVTLESFLYHAFSFRMTSEGAAGIISGLLPIVIGTALALWKQRPGAEGALGGLAVALMWSFFFSKQAFINYYYLVSSILLLQVVLLIRQMETPEEDKSPESAKLAAAGKSGKK